MTSTAAIATVVLGLVGLALWVAIWIEPILHRRFMKSLAAEEERCRRCGEEMYPFEEHCCYGGRES